MIYCYAKANQMKKHNFTDDVAVVKAMSKRSALKKFSYLYDDVLYESSYMTELETQDSFYPIDEYGLIQV